MRGRAAGGTFIGRQIAVVVTLALVGVLGFAGFYERAFARKGRDLDAELSALRKFRWERPVLRGAAGDGNAAEEVYAALVDFRPLDEPTRKQLAQAVFHGQPLSAAASAALEQRRPVLQALRDATQQSWARTDLEPERGLGLRIPAYPQIVEAGLCLLAQAQLGSSDTCLATASDTIRLGQDLVPAAPLEAVSAATHLTALAARVIIRCAQRADLPVLRRTGHELHLLATHPPPTGTGIEFEELLAGIEMQSRAALTNKGSPLHVGSTVLTRPQLLAAWSMYEHPARFRQITPEHYPDALEEWKREHDFRLRSNTPDVVQSAENVLGRLQDDLRGQALLRMLAIGVSTLAERAYRGTLPSQPAGLRDAALADPYRGKPLSYHVATAANELTLWAVGEDFHDDGGSDIWNGAAPRDVTLHFALPALSPPVVTKR